MPDVTELTTTAVEVVSRRRTATMRALGSQIMDAFDYYHGRENGRDDFFRYARRLEDAAATSLGGTAVTGYARVLEALELELGELPTPPRVLYYDWNTFYDTMSAGLAAAEIAPAAAGASATSTLAAVTTLADLFDRAGGDGEEYLDDGEPEDDLTPRQRLLDRAQVGLEDELSEKYEDLVTTTRARVYRDAPVGSSRDAIRGYRRVVHPEISQGGACGLCMVASTQFYHIPDLRPVHQRCHCDVVPVTRDSDPGSSMNKLDLGDLYEAAANSTNAVDLKRVRVNGDGVIVEKPTRATDNPYTGKGRKRRRSAR